MWRDDVVHISVGQWHIKNFQKEFCVEENRSFYTNFGLETSEIKTAFNYI